MSNSAASSNSNSTAQDNAGRKGTFAALAGLLPFLKPYRRQFVLAGIALLVAAGATLVIPYAFKQMIDHGFGAAAGGKSIANVNATFLALFGVAAVLGVATAARFYMVSWLGERVTADIRSAVYGHVVRQSPEFFETTRTGEVLSRLTTDTTLIQAVVGTSISLALRNALLFVGGLAMLFVTSAKLTSIILGLLVLVVVPDRAVRPARAQAVARRAGPHRRRLGAWPARSSTPCRPCRPTPPRHAKPARFGASVDHAFADRDAAHPRALLLTMLAIVLVFGAIVFVLWLGAHAVLAGR